MSVNLCNGGECEHCGDDCIVVSEPILREDGAFPEPLQRFSDSGGYGAGGGYNIHGLHYAKRRSNGDPPRYAKCVCPTCGSPYWGIVFPNLWFDENRWEVVDMTYRHAINDEPRDNDRPLKPVRAERYDEKVRRAMAFEAIHESRVTPS